MTLYVVFNINGDIIGVADSPENACNIYEQRYAYDDIDYYYAEYEHRIAYLKSLANPRIQEFDLNKFYYA